MRKNIIIMVIAMFALQVPTQAQTYDTLRGPNGKLPGYHYTHWFDSCDAWNDTTEFGWLYINHWIGGYCNLWAIENHVEFPALIKGFGVMAETMETNRELLESQHGRDTGPRMPEYVYMWMGCRHREERDPPLLIRHATTLPNSRYTTCPLELTQTGLDLSILHFSRYFWTSPFMWTEGTYFY